MAWDSKWRVVAAVVPVVALFVPFLLFILSRETKGLAFDTVSTAVLVDLSDPELSSLKLTYKDISVSRLTVATFEVRNSGTQPIEGKAFERPLVIRFKNPSDVLAATLGEKTPQDLNPSITSDDRGITIAPLLLNSGDKFRITVQLRGDFNEPTAEARISGVPSISRQTLHESDPTRRGFSLIAAGVVTTLLYFYFAIFSITTLFRRRPYTLVPMPETIALVLALGVGSAGLAVLGAQIVGLSKTQILSGTAVVALLSAIVVTPFAVWKSSRLWDMLKA